MTQSYTTPVEPHPHHDSAGYMVFEGDQLQCDEQGYYYTLKRKKRGSEWFLEANGGVCADRPGSDVPVMVMRKRGTAWSEYMTRGSDDLK